MSDLAAYLAEQQFRDYAKSRGEDPDEIIRRAGEAMPETPTPRPMTNEDILAVVEDELRKEEHDLDQDQARPAGVVVETGDVRVGNGACSCLQSFFQCGCFVGL